MQPKKLTIAALALAALACAPAKVDPDYQTLTLTLPRGDPEVGRLVFMDLACTTCHTVAGERGLPAPVTAYPGPELGEVQARMDAGALATSILVPTRHVAEDYRGRAEGTVPPMGDYPEMGVDELVDLIAYVQSLGADS